MCCIAYWIAFGAHGPRAVAPPGEGWKVLGYTLAGVLVSFGIFAGVRSFARGPPATMTKEYQEASNEYLLVRSPLPSPKAPPTSKK
jgi:cytochrome c oxidase subunit 4